MSKKLSALFDLASATITKAAELYSLLRILLRDEPYPSRFDLRKRRLRLWVKWQKQKIPSGQRFTKKQEKEIGQVVLKEGFEATDISILALASSKLREDEPVRNSCVSNFQNRYPEAHKAVDSQKKSLQQPFATAKPRMTRPNAANRKFIRE